MNLKNICQHIYYAAISATSGFISPIAYIKVRIGKRFTFTEDELLEEFDKSKWNTVISTADLSITKDDNLDCVLKIDEITDFFDDDGKCNTFVVSDEDSIIL